MRNPVRKALGWLREKTYTWASFGVHYFGPGSRIAPGWYGGAGIEDAYEANAVAYSCISTQARDVAGVPLLFLSDPDDPESAVPDSDPVRQLFLQPNAALSTREYLEAATILMLLRGECFTVFDNPRAPKQMTPFFDPLAWREQTRDLATPGGAATELLSWRYQKGETSFSLMPGDVMHSKRINPGKPFRGLSPLQAAAQAVKIDSRGDKLNASLMDRGGERPLMYEPKLTKETQLEQAAAQIRSRRGASGEVPRDIILPSGVMPLDPKFTSSDLDIIATQFPSIEKICWVYGMNPFLIGKGDAAKYDSSSGIIKLYWSRTLVPQLGALESTWDAFFVRRRGLRTHVRFDRSKIDALREDELQQARVAAVYLSKGIPAAEVNRRFNLGFDDAAIPGSDDVLVNANLVPASALIGWDHAEPEPPAPAPAPPVAEPPEKADQAPPLAARVKAARAHLRGRTKAGASARIRRNRRMAGLERKLRAEWKRTLAEYKAAAVQALEESMPHGPDAQAVTVFQDKLMDAMSGMGDDLAEVVAPFYTDAATEGVVSIQEAAGVKAAYSEHAKAVTFTPEVTRIAEKRGNYIRANIPERLIGEINEAVHTAASEAIAEGEPLGAVVKAVKHQFTVEANHATTIARTEVGTLFNTGRFEEMGNQGFDQHEWLTAKDEATRDGVNSEFDHWNCDGEVVTRGENFSCGLRHPQEDGGAAGNVINCRCETIPATEG